MLLFDLEFMVVVVPLQPFDQLLRNANTQYLHYWFIQTQTSQEN